MRRRLFAILSAVSLALCVATCVLWVRGYWRFQEIGFALDGRAVFARSFDGRVYLHRNLSEDADFRPFPAYTFSRSLDDADSGSYEAEARWTVLGFGSYRRREPAGGGYEAASVPHWFVAVVLLLPAWFFGREWSRRQRTRTGLCPTCGYDLRATPDRCPECGAKPQPT